MIHVNFQRYFLLAVLYALSPWLIAQQEGECYSKKEKEIFELVNTVRAKEGLEPFTFSNQLTHGAVEQARRYLKNPDASYLQLQEFSPQYTAIAYPLSTHMSSKFFSAQAVLDAFFEYDEMKKHFIDGGSLKFVSMGLAVEDNLCYIYLGEKPDDPGQMIYCTEPDPKSLPYTWVREPGIPYCKFFEAEGVVSVRLSYDNWGFMDTAGNMQIPAEYEGNTWFEKGLACVIRDGKAALINHSNEIVFPFGPYSMIVLDPGYPRMTLQEGEKVYLADMDGKILSQACDEIDIAGNGYYSFYINAKKGVMDLNGKVILPPTYQEIEACSEGYYPYQQGGKWGFLDKNFKVKLAPRYGGPVAYGFFNGLSHYSVNNKVGFMDTTQKIVLPAIYDEAGMFNEHGHCMVSYGGKYGVIDRSGKFMIPAMYENIQRNCKDNYWIVKQNGLYGILDNNNQWKLKPEFEDMWPLERNRFLVQTGGEWGMIAVNF